MQISYRLDPQRIKESQLNNVIDPTIKRQIIDNYSDLYQDVMDWLGRLIRNMEQYPDAIVYDVLDFASEVLQNSVDLTTQIQNPYIEYFVDCLPTSIQVEVRNNGPYFFDTSLFRSVGSNNLFDSTKGLSGKSYLPYKTYGGAGYGLLKIVSTVEQYNRGSEFYVGDNFESGFAITGIKLVIH
jgi:hypothetical protein